MRHGVASGDDPLQHLGRTDKQLRADAQAQIPDRQRTGVQPLQQYPRRRGGIKNIADLRVAGEEGLQAFLQGHVVVAVGKHRKAGARRIAVHIETNIRTRLCPA